MRPKRSSLWLSLLTLPLALGLACGGGGDTPPPAATATPVPTPTPTPVPPPVISALAATSTVAQNATVTWTTDRSCTAEVTYSKTSGTTMTRKSLDLSTSGSVLIDLLEPSTEYSISVKVTDAGNRTSTGTTTVTTPATLGVATVTVTVDPATTQPISPYIYGLNFNGIASAPAHLTINRMGGNRWTAYNWENNYSNAGNDYQYNNDSFLSGSTIPAEPVRVGIAADQAAGRASIMTVQMQGYVSADTAGAMPQIATPASLSAHFKKVIEKKSTVAGAAPFTINPDTSDANVYMDEFLYAMDQKLPGLFAAGAAQPTFVSLDNEPELWSGTHEEIQGATPITSDAYIQKTITLSKALKDQFPDLKVFGPAHYGFQGFYTWQNEMDSGGNPVFDSTHWFADKYLQAIKAASTTYGKPLVDVYDIHWYSEAWDGVDRITKLTSATLTDYQIQVIVQSPRSLWDTTYKEDSWIAKDVLGGPIFILKRLQDKIAATWPGTKLAITEYANGGDGHIAGAIVEADNLGVFGSMGIYAATLWSNGTYPLAGFKAYRGFDGASASFGDTSLKATSSNTALVSTYVSKDSAVIGRTVIVAINRSNAVQDVTFSGLSVAGTAKVYRLDASDGPNPYLAGTLPVDLGTAVITLPPYTVSTIEIQ